MEMYNPSVKVTFSLRDFLNIFDLSSEPTLYLRRSNCVASDVEARVEIMIMMKKAHFELVKKFKPPFLIFPGDQEEFSRI